MFLFQKVSNNLHCFVCLSLAVLAGCTEYPESQNELNKSKYEHYVTPKPKGALRIAVTSCAKYSEIEDQPVWGYIQAQQPDMLLLLGDNVYLGDRQINKLASKLEIAEGGAELPNVGNTKKWMEIVYDKQWGERHFAELIKTVPYFATWDDHDVGENNVKPYDYTKEQIVNNRYWLARELFNKRLVKRDMPELYETLNAKVTHVDGTLSDVSGLRFKNEDTLDYAVVVRVSLFIMLDGISRRSEKQVVSQAQLDWVDKMITHHAGKGFAFVVTGAPINFTSDEWSWNEHPRSYKALLKVLNRHDNVIFLAGDKHELGSIPPIDGETKFHELVASGAAFNKTKGKRPRQNNYLILDVLPKASETSDNVVKYYFHGPDFSGERKHFNKRKFKHHDESRTGEIVFESLELN